MSTDENPPAASTGSDEPVVTSAPDEPAVTPGSDEPVVTSAPDEPAATPGSDAPPVTTGDEEPSEDTGRHAAVRPDPVPPPPARPSTRRPPATSPTTAPTTNPATAPTTSIDATAPAATTQAPAQAPAPAAVADTVVGPPVVDPVPATPVDGTPLVATPAPASAATAPRPAGPGDDRLFPEPNAPRTTSAGTHWLGAFVGLVLGPLAAGVLLLGQSRILAAQVPHWDATVDWSGVVLVVLGLLALGWVAVLAVWTPAAPITGGTVLTLLGGAALAAPDVVHTQVTRLVDTSEWRSTFVEVTVAGTSGTLLVAGFLVLLAGVASAAAHRRGLRLGAFRERHR